MLKKIMHIIKSGLPRVTVRSHEKVEREKIRDKLISEDSGFALWDMDIDANVTVSPDTRVTWSQEFKQMLGFNNEDDFPNTLGSWSTRLHPEDRQKALDALAAHLDDQTGKKPYNVKYRLMLKDGEYRHFHARGYAQRNHKGIPVKMLGSQKDINDTQQIESLMQYNSQMLESKQKILSSLQNLGTALLVASNSIFNKALIKSMGTVGQMLRADRVQIWQNEMIGENLHFTLIDEWLSDLGIELESVPKCLTFPYDTVPGWDTKLKRGKYINSPITDMLPHESAYFSSYKVKSLLIIPLFRGNEFWGFLRIDDCQAERAFSEDEVIDASIAGQFFAFTIMVCEDLSANSVNKEETAELIHWYQSILDSIPIPISVTDADMSLTFINTAVERMFGKKRDNIYGKPCSILEMKICNTPDCGIACAKRYVDRTFFNSFGKSYQVDVSKINDLAGEPAGFVEIIQDTTNQ